MPTRSDFVAISYHCTYNAIFKFWTSIMDINWY